MNCRSEHHQVARDLAPHLLLAGPVTGDCRSPGTHCRRAPDGSGASRNIPAGSTGRSTSHYCGGAGTASRTSRRSAARPAIHRREADAESRPASLRQSNTPVPAKTGSGTGGLHRVVELRLPRPELHNAREPPCPHLGRRGLRSPGVPLEHRLWRELQQGPGVTRHRRPPAQPGVLPVTGASGGLAGPRSWGRGRDGATGISRPVLRDRRRE
jgi:hypothetical protein